jgi:hypothetical protein
VVIPDRPATCENRGALPPDCEPAWRIRIDLPPDAQRVGRYPLAEGSAVFAYRDAQAKAQGAWVAGQHCKNLGANVTGELEIVAVESHAIRGVLRAAGYADVSFRAERCAACLGTGVACRTDAECCNAFCDKTCKP